MTLRPCLTVKSRCRRRSRATKERALATRTPRREAISEFVREPLLSNRSRSSPSRRARTSSVVMGSAMFATFPVGGARRSCRFEIASCRPFGDRSERCISVVCDKARQVGTSSREWATSNAIGVAATG